MTKGALQPMQSSRLAECAMPIPCYVCEAPNTLEAEYCNLCAAPMALAHQVQNHQVSPQMVAVLGASGTGKTVFLGMLMDMLSRQPQQQMQLFTRGAFSVNLQQTTVSALARCEFPAKTANEPDRWNWVHCEIHRSEEPRKADLIMPDMAGEALLEEVDHPHAYRVVRSFLKKSSAAMILIDAIALGSGNRDQDFFAMKLLNYLIEVEPHAKHGWAKRPVALVFTKVDGAEQCRENPALFAKTHAAGTWRQCQQRYDDHRFFAASAVGCCAWRDSPSLGPRQVPLRVEPHGIIQPFEWVMGQLSHGKRQRPQ